MLGWILVLAVRLEQGCVLEPECLQVRRGAYCTVVHF